MWFSHKRRKDKRNDVVHDKVLGAGPNAVRVAPQHDPNQALKDALKSTPSSKTVASRGWPAVQSGTSVPQGSGPSASGSGVASGDTAPPATANSLPSGSWPAPTEVPSGLNTLASPPGPTNDKLGGGSPAIAGMHNGSGALPSYPSAEQDILQQQQQQQQRTLQRQHGLQQQQAQFQIQQQQRHAQESQQQQRHADELLVQQQKSQQQLQQQQHDTAPFPSGSPAWNNSPQMQMHLQMLHRMQQEARLPSYQGPPAAATFVSPAALAQRTNLLQQAAIQAAQQHAALPHACTPPALPSLGSANPGMLLPGSRALHDALQQAAAYGQLTSQASPFSSPVGSSPSTLPQHLQHPQHTQIGLSQATQTPRYPTGFPQASSPLHHSALQHPGPTPSTHFRQQQETPSNAGPASVHEQASAMHDASSHLRQQGLQGRPGSADPAPTHEQHPTSHTGNDDLRPQQGLQGRISLADPASVHKQPSLMHGTVRPLSDTHARQQAMLLNSIAAEPALIHQQGLAMHDARRPQPDTQPQLAPHPSHGKERLQALLALTPQQHSQLGAEPAKAADPGPAVKHESMPHASLSLTERTERCSLSTPIPPKPAASLTQATAAPTHVYHPQQPTPVSQVVGPHRTGMSPVEALKQGLFGKELPSFQQRSRFGPSPAAVSHEASPEPMDEDEQQPSDDDSGDYSDMANDEGMKDDEESQSAGAPDATQTQLRSHPLSQQSEYTPLEDRQAYYSAAPQYSPQVAELRQQQSAPGTGPPRAHPSRLGAGSRSMSPDARKTMSGTRNPSGERPHERAASGEPSHTALPAQSEQERYRRQQQLFRQQLQQGQAQASAQQQSPSPSGNAASQPLKPLVRHESQPAPTSLQPLSRQPYIPKVEQSAPKKPAGKPKESRQLSAAPSKSIVPGLLGPASLGHRSPGQPGGTPQASGSEDEETEDEAEALQVSNDAKTPSFPRSYSQHMGPCW